MPTKSPSAPSILAIDHVQITIPPGQEPAARHFYSTLLGLPELPKPASLQSRGGLWLLAGNTPLHIGTEPDFDRTQTKAHVAYRVSDLDAWRQLLQRHGIQILDSIPIPGHARFEFRDPFGNRVEFIQPLESP